MSLRTQKISRLLEYVTTKHLVFGSTIYCMFESENTEKSVRVVPGTDNSDKWLINNYLQLYPSSSGPYTVQRKARSSQRLKETQEAKRGRGKELQGLFKHLMTAASTHQQQSQNSSSAGNSTQMLQIHQHIDLESFSSKKSQEEARSPRDPIWFKYWRMYFSNRRKDWTGQRSAADGEVFNVDGIIEAWIEDNVICYRGRKTEGMWW